MRSYFSLSDGSMGRNVIIFGSDMSSTVHIDNKGKAILILKKFSRKFQKNFQENDEYYLQFFLDECLHKL